MVSSTSASKPTLRAPEGKKVALVVSRYHEELTHELLKGATDTLKKLGVTPTNTEVFWVPGAFEIPLVARTLSHQEWDAIICLGVIVKGETAHDTYIASEVARGINAVMQSSGIPVLFGVLTVQTLAQAKARVGGDRGHKGVESAEAAVEMMMLMDRLEGVQTKEQRSVGFGGR
jgi:6,7-dimethyl-8-ribityllumazine synthase